MRFFRIVRLFIIAMCVLMGFPVDTPGQQAEPQTKKWTIGGAIGFLGNTPDGTAFALNVDGGILLEQDFSIGPLLQVAFTGDLEQIGFSGQGKYWIDIPNTDHRGKLTLQGGLGVVHADRFGSDTSFLIPLGVGLDYRLNQAIAVYTDFLLNFTDLDTEPNRGDDTNIMPGLTVGARF